MLRRLRIFVVSRYQPRHAVVLDPGPHDYFLHSMRLFRRFAALRGDVGVYCAVACTDLSGFDHAVA